MTTGPMVDELLALRAGLWVLAEMLMERGGDEMRAFHRAWIVRYEQMKREGGVASVPTLPVG
jgi:hypothetical protein